MPYYGVLDRAPRGRAEGPDDWQLWNSSAATSTRRRGAGDDPGDHHVADRRWSSARPAASAAGSPAPWPGAGWDVVGVARTAGPPADLTEVPGSTVVELADATDPTVARGLLDRHAPQSLVSWPAPPRRCARCRSRPGDVLGQLGDRRADDLPLAARGAPAAAPTGKSRDRHEQRRRGSGLTVERWICGRQGHAAVHGSLRPGGSRSPRPGDRVHGDPAAHHSADRSRPAGGAGLRRAQRPAPRRSTWSRWARRWRRRPRVAQSLELLGLERSDLAPAYLVTGAGLKPLGYRRPSIVVPRASSSGEAPLSYRSALDDLSIRRASSRPGGVAQCANIRWASCRPPKRRRRGDPFPVGRRATPGVGQTLLIICILSVALCFTAGAYFTGH